MEAQRGSVNCSKLYVLWWTQDLDMDTRVHVIKHWQCCLHVHQDTHAASKLASLLLFLSPYNLFYTHSSHSGLSKTRTSIHIPPGGFPHSPWNEIQTPVKFASLPCRSNHMALPSVLKLTKLQPFPPPARSSLRVFPQLASDHCRP